MQEMSKKIAKKCQSITAKREKEQKEHKAVQE